MQPVGAVPADVDVRVVFGNASRFAAVDSPGQFREDSPYYRLNVVMLRLPCAGCQA